VAIGRRSGAVARLITGGRRSPEGECAVIEQSRCDALSWEPEPVNPRVGIGEPWVPFLDSDEVRSASAGLGKSQGATFLLGFGLGILSFSSFDSVLFDSNPNQFLLVLAVKTLDLNQIESA
jgi:hypothetical protein